MNNTTVYCDFQNFHDAYEEVHGPLSFLVCVFGSIANILNICVLTTKEMRWPTNLILTGLAIADLLVMLEYIPFTMHRYLDGDSKKYASHFTYKWALFMIFHAYFSLTFHFISCCLTVILAIWRYIIITNPHNSNHYCGMRRTFTVITLSYVLCPILSMPIILSLKVLSYNQTTTFSGRIIDRIDLPSYHNDQITHQQIFYIDFISERHQQVSLWLYGVLIKLVPCILLTHLSHKIISVLIETKRRRRLLLNGSLPLNNLTEARSVLSRKFQKDRQADRTSGMLVAVLLLFLLTEFPQAILGLLSATKGKRFQDECYLRLGNISQ
ncbi:G-protein coupled receptor dmsr-1-like [Aethina tumida]|uniref:G-protein coupled receptor dmsr-1-like n=1 Tax=Aethina tumida TaxID=116153 RepID=UPI0021493A9F|nr:G-protein coupled receptor dmsr-1-like [Aethina tumida]